MLATPNFEKLMGFWRCRLSLVEGSIWSFFNITSSFSLFFLFFPIWLWFLADTCLPFCCMHAPGGIQLCEVTLLLCFPVMLQLWIKFSSHYKECSFFLLAGFLCKEGHFSNLSLTLWSFPQKLCFVSFSFDIQSGLEWLWTGLSSSTASQSPASPY